MWRPNISILLVLLCLAGCANDDVTAPPHGEVYYPIETDPALSVSREYVYFAMRDTLVPSLSGVYRALVTRPERELVWRDSSLTLTSPSPSSDGNRIVALDQGILCIYKVGDSTVKYRGDMGICRAACMVGNLNIILERNSVLSQLFIDGISSVTLRAGNDPVAYSGDSYLCVVPTTQFNWAIIEAHLSGVVDTVYKVTATTRPHWPQLSADRKKLAFAREIASGYELVIRDLNGATETVVATSKYAKSCLIGNYLLFTGEKPLLNQVSTFGGSISLWIYAVPND